MKFHICEKSRDFHEKIGQNRHFDSFSNFTSDEGLIQSKGT